MKANSKSFLTLQDLAAHWRISVKSVRRIVARGELKVHRIGNQIRVSPDDVAAYEKLHRE
jgi:excisionase family DNA binding protein